MLTDVRLLRGVRKGLTLKFLTIAVLAVLVLMVAVSLLLTAYSGQYIRAEADLISHVQIDDFTRNLESIYGLMSDRTQASMQTLQFLGRGRGNAVLGKPVLLGGTNLPDLMFGGQSQVGNHSIVDQVKSLTDSTATLFVKRDSDYVRVTTNVLKDDGTRAVGTVLDPEGKAYAAIREGRTYHGVADILGSPYFTSYEPITDSGGRTIGVWYVGYPISALKEIEAAIVRAKILENGFFALFDAKGQLRFRPSAVSSEAVSRVFEQRQSAAKGEGDWVVLVKPVESWGYSMMAAYPKSDVESQISVIRRYVWLSGLLLSLLTGFALVFLMDRLVLRPIKQFEAAANRVARGDLNVSVRLAREDELGRLSESLDALIRDLKEKALQLKGVADGDLSVEIRRKSDEDALSISMSQVVANLRQLMAEIGMLNRSALEGRLSMRGNAASFSGAYREIVEGINRTLGSVIEPINEAAAVLEGVARKDLSVRVKGGYAGDLAKIKNSLNLAVQNLEDALLQVATSARQVASAAGQVSASSQSSSQDATEQAASLEEVAGSLKELSAASGLNAASANQARLLTDGARNSAGKGVDSMKRLSCAIDRIKVSSDETAKIVKTIDEIAFQTNLLALNAAVEAARAGDAGKGFAVVAEEVRNLAIRSAEAAKSTSRLIQESVKNSESGVALNNEVLKNLTDIDDQVHRVTQMMSEISAASERQSEGVRQLNTVVDQMNQVTQQTAASSEESASAAEELAGQAAEMEGVISSFKLSAAGDAGRSVFAVGTAHPLHIDFGHTEHPVAKVNGGDLR